MNISDNERYEALQAEGWVIDEGTIFCDECKDSLRNY